MGDTKLYLFLLLSAYALAETSIEVTDQEAQTQPSCPLEARYKNFRKYVYEYTAESTNGVAGTANIKNGPKISCKVELEVPQTCSFVLRTTDCSLSEVTVIDAQGQPVYSSAPGTELFKAAMEKNPLNFVVQQVTEVSIYPEKDEPENIVNIKRGIISALLAPVLEEEHNNKMTTIHGLCRTDLTVNSRKDIDVDVTVVRDLSECSHFSPHRLPTSPLSLLPGLNGLVSKLISSSQTCNYQFDNRKKHMTEAQCTEKHLFIPFSHEDQYGIVSEVKQSLTLKEIVKFNDRNFDTDGKVERKLFPEEVEDKFFTQDKEDVLTTMKTLNDLTLSGRNQERARLFQKLVSQIRGMKNETLSAAVEKMMEVSNWLTWQALFQCGTRECTSAILQILRGFEGPAREVDAIVYALGLLPQASPERLRDMLSMAQHKPSKAIMYALANTVKKFPQTDALTMPEVREVAEFMEFMLGDCSGDEDKTFLTLRVIGVMGKYMEGFPSLKSSLLNCMRQSDASLSVQKSAIQAFRLMKIDPDVSSALMEQYKDAAAPAQKRIAAYLMLMRNPEVVEEVLKTLKDEQDLQVKSFVISHLTNLLDSADPNLQTAKDHITNALETDDSLSAMDFTKFSHNYKIEVPWTGSVESNVIFDSVNYMPKQVMLATTLDAFNTEILEIGVEGEGFEPAIEALFGENGFFPDTISKALYWANDQVPPKVGRVLENWIAPLQSSRLKREVSQNIFNQIKDNFDKLGKGLKYLEDSKDAPKAMAYLRFMGTELGYMKTSELNGIIENIITYSELFFHTLPVEFLKKLSSGIDNEVFAHYMFLDKAFTLPTGAGLPLKFSLAGVFAPGATGGLTFDRSMQQLSFRPSAGVEFVTQMGVYIPEFVDAGIRMHTNMYHESGLNAKFTISGSQVKLSIPAPKENTQLISISNELLSLTSTMTRKVSPIVEDRTDSTECNPLFLGLKYCTTVRYSNASSTNSAPYYPLTGETRFALELQPTGEVSEYTATMAYELLREGKEGRHKVDSLVLLLKAEGSTPTTATAAFKYNRNKKIFTSELQVPDYDVEAGFKMEVTDGTGKGKNTYGITIDVTNKKAVQLSLVGRVRLESMEDGELQLQVAVPPLQMDASATARLKNADGLVLQLETAFNCPETSSLQKAVLRYDENKVELEIKSDMNSEVTKHFPNIDDYYSQLQGFIDDILDQKVTDTDMKLRHIVLKGIEAGNIWLDKFGKDIPYVKNLRNKRFIPQLTMPSIPENLYLKSDALFRYQFNKDKISFSLPLPFGGKSSEELNIPSYIHVPPLGPMKSETKYKIPSFTIPYTLDFSLPQLGVAEVSAKVNSNLYDWEGSISGGNYTVDVPSYIAKYKVMGSCPVEALAYKVEGTALVYGTVDDHFKYLVNGSLHHSFLDASFSASESMTVTKSMTDDIESSKGTAVYKYEATSPFGLQTSLYYSTQATFTGLDLAGDANVDGVLKIGPWFANSAYSLSYTVNPLEEKGKGESILTFDSSVIQGKNVIKGEYLNKDLVIVSKTTTENDALNHVGELRYKDGHLFLKSDAGAVALGKTLRCQAELDLAEEEASFRVETQADHATNRAYSLLTGALNSNGLEVNIDGSLNFEDSRGTHKGTFTLGMTGLATSCTTTLQCSSMTFENIFNAGIDGTGASMSLTSKGLAQDNTAELSVEGKISDSGVYLNSVFKGNAFDGDARNTMNLGLNKQGLTLSNTMMGTLQKMRTESTHILTVTLWTLAFHSKTDNIICDGASYNHDIKVNMRPFAVSVSSNNKLEMFDINFSNDGHIKVEPLKLDASGSITGKYGEEHTIKSTCGITFSEMTGSVKCDSTAEVLDSQVRHNFELDFAGLSSVINSEVRLNSKALRLENVIRAMAMPFSLTVDALLNGDGSVKFYGKHTGQLYSKFLLKAEPFAIAESHDWRASATHMLQNGDSAETHFENKFDGLLIPNEQSVLWKFKSKLNNHAYNQEVNIYNKEADMGVQLSGVLQTNLFNKAAESPFNNQEFSVAGFLKYDKNSDCHIIHLPFIESLPVAFEKMKTTFVNVLESLQQYLDGLDINDLARQFRENLDEIPQMVTDFIEEIDLENKFNLAKDKVISLVQDYGVTLDDLEASLENLKKTLEKTLIDLAAKIRDLKAQIKSLIESGSWAEILTNIGDELKAVDERYDITGTIIRVISAIEDVIRQIDLQKLQDSSVAWLKELDAKYEIKAKIQEKVSELKEVIETFDIKMLVQDVTDYISSFDLAQYVDQLSDYIPLEDIEEVLDSMKDIIVNWIEEYEIVEKMNYVYSKIGELFQRYEIEKKMEVFLEQARTLIKQYKIRETVEAMVDALKSIPFEYFSDKVLQLLGTIVNQLKLIDIKQNIEDLNDYILMIIKNLKAFDYNEFVDEANMQIRKITNYVNEQIKVYEIPEKIEASRKFLREMQTSIINYLEQLKNTKIAELYRMIKGVIDTTAYKDIKLKIQDILEDMRQRISDMDIRDEILVYLQRASESYTNMIEYISSQLQSFIEEIRRLSKDEKILTQIHQAVEGVLNYLKTAQIEIQAFTLPFTTLEVPAFQINMARLPDISIPTVITVPEFKILDFIHVPSITIDFEIIKNKIIQVIDQIREFKMPELDPEATFGDLRALYLFDLPDFTLPEVRLVELKFSEINIPKLNLENFEITMLPIPEVKLPQIPFEPCIPAFGKLYGEFKFNSPQFTVVTEAAIENTTSKILEPQFKATLTSRATSTLDVLGYSLEAMLQIEAPTKKKMIISETVKANHMAFTVDHEGSLIFSNPSVEALAKTTAKATTQTYKADLVNNIVVALKNGITVNMDTTYGHDLNIHSMDISSEAMIKNTAKAQFESGTISMTVENEAKGKWSLKDYADEGTHKSSLGFSVNTGTAQLTFDGETNSNSFKMKQSVNAESVILSHITIDASAETETPFMKTSVIKLTGKAQMEGLKVELAASHNAELIGKVSGTLSNSCAFLAQPFEISLDCKNKVGSKILFPLKLTGKIDLQHDYKVALSSENQHASWVGLARFNQYKYNHNFTLDNNEKDAGIYVSIDGEANLDFLTVPLTVPEMTVPYFDRKTPMIKEYSLWEDLGLKDLLATPRQSFDIDFNLRYQKNPDKHTFALDLKPIYNIFENAKFLGAHFELGRDKVLDALTNSYNQARTQFEKFKIDTSNQPPRYFTVPGYTVPILNIEVSAFRAELPAFGFFIPKEVSTPSFKVPVMGFSVPSYTLVLPSLGLPVLHVPETLRELTLPTVTLPDIQNNIMIPALGNVTYDFSFKSPVISVSSNGGIFNQSDFVVKVGASSTSVFEFLKGKLDGTTSITKKRGLKVATTLSLEHKNAEYTHESTISLTKRNMEASVANALKINLPFFTLDLNQVLDGNTKTKPNVASKVKLQYTYNIPSLQTQGNGILHHNLALETLSSYFSLENSLRAKTYGTILETGRFSKSLDNEATIYLNANGLRSTVKTDINSEAEYMKTEIWNVDIAEIFAFEASLRRVYATVNYTSKNKVNIASYSTNGKHSAQGTFEFVPLTTLSANLNMDISQSSDLGLVSIVQNVDIDVTSDKQKFIWSGKEQLTSLKHSSDLLMSNDESEIRMEVTESIEGHLAFLKSIKLPVYQKTLWDVLKFDEATSTDQLQFLNVSTHLVYTKSMDGTLFALPATVFENGVTFDIPAITLAVPEWVKQIPQMIREIDERLENVDLPDYISLPPVITIPTFDVPLTTLRVPSFTLDLQNLRVPNMISTTAFDITLPGLPVVSIPHFEIDLEYMKDKMALLLLKLPQYEITISHFTLPKTFTIGEHTINLDDVTKAIYHFEMPTITIPEQKIEIPEISLHLPTSIFIPSFGALSTAVKLSSSIYNNTWTAKMENKKPGFAYSLKSSCTSTMTFLAYDLDAIANVLLENGAVSLDGKCTFTHNDVKVNWKHDLRQNLRIKREEPLASRPSSHTLDIDINSQTFADVSFRYASNNNGITSSVSSPSAGFVGFQFTRRSPSQYYAKLFSRYLTTPDKDTDLLSFKVTLKNSEKLNLQTGWQLNGFFDMINGFKVRLPAITSALRDFVNKYHKAHFGMDLNRAALKLKNAISNNIDKAYSELPKAFDAMQNSIEYLSQQSKDMLKRTVQSMPEMNIQEMSSRVSNNVKELLQNYETNVRVMLDAIMKFLSETKFHLPGFEEKLTGQEMYNKMRRFISMAVRRAASRFTSLMETIADTIASYINGMNFTLPGTDVVIVGKDVLKDLKSAVRSAQDKIIQAMKKWEGLKLEKLLQNVSDFVKLCIQKAGEFIASLKDERLEELSAHLSGIYTEASNSPMMQEITKQIQLAKVNAADYKDKAKLRVQEIYNEISMERLNSEMSEFISVLEKQLRNHTEVVLEYAKKASQHTQPYIRVTSKKIDVDVPLPFYWNSFSEWPSLT
ncbi:apolipoprotein B-100 [Colossoma macropomum]|uniref:apolipoprotein B-100 n=1 Tax=Colossoma macropomum TaxID=42526 RepID=UPI001863C1B8|nr:apolipoprotein B-100 [Colossoma macropomum]